MKACRGIWGRLVPGSGLRYVYRQP